VQGIKKKLNGRYLEHVGIWTPHKNKTVPRQMALNKHRIKYWLSVGATPTGRVQRIFEKFDLLPPKPTPFGKYHQYEVPEKSYHMQHYPAMGYKGATHINQYHFLYRARL